MTQAPVSEETPTPSAEAPASEAVAEVDPHEEKIAELNDKLKEAEENRKKAARAVKQLEQAGINNGPAFDQIAGSLKEAESKVENVKTAIETENKKHQLLKIAQPLVDAIGTFDIGTGTLPTALNLGDIKTRRDKAQEKIDAATAEIKFLDHVASALEKVEVDQASWDNMKPLNIIRIPDTTLVKVAIATRAGRSAGSGDGRASSRDQVTIVAANDDYKHLIGRKIYGEGAEYTTWVNLLEKEAPEVEEERKRKMAEGSNSSAKVVAFKKLGVKAE